MAQQCTPLWSPELCVLWVPSIGAAWVLLLWLADNCGCTGLRRWPSVPLAARPCLVWRLPTAGGWGWVVGGAGSWLGWLHGHPPPNLVMACRWLAGF